MRNLFFILSFFPYILYSQNSAVPKPITCASSSAKMSSLYVEYMKGNYPLSTKSLLNQWEEKCGLCEPVYRAKILFALKTGTFNDSLFSTQSIEHIFNYQSRIKHLTSANTYWYDSKEAYYGYVPPGKDFDNYTRELAATLKLNYPEESTEYMLSEFYSTNSDSIFLKLQSPSCPKSALQKEYYTVVKKYRRKIEFHIAAITGIWIPTGKLAILGVHPEIGFQAGWKRMRMNYDFTVIMRFLDSPNNYYARIGYGDDARVLTNFFFGIYGGFDIGVDLFAKKGHEIQCVGGIAFDGIGVSANRTALSYNFNVGLGYRYYIRNGFYVGLKAKYNIVNYTLDKLLDYTGNAVTVHFFVGGVNNRYRNNNLTALKYPLRK